MSCAYLPRGTDKPSDTLVFALFKGMNCLLTLPKKRSVPMKKLKCLARKSSTRPLVKPAVPPAMFPGGFKPLHRTNSGCKLGLMVGKLAGHAAGVEETETEVAITGRVYSAPRLMVAARACDCDFFPSS